MNGLEICTVKAGRVLITGKVYRPSEQSLPYDGQLDGQRFVFSIPPGCDFVHLWGTEDAYRRRKTSLASDIVEVSPPWEWWYLPDAKKEGDVRTFWTVWAEGTGGGYGHQHSSLSEAKEEAIRLALKTGKRVFVLMLVGSYAPAAPVWEAIE